MTEGYEFDLVTSRLATGGGVTDAGFVEALVKAGVTHVVDVTDAEDDRSLLANHPQIQGYLYNPIADDGQHPKPPEWFASSLSFALPVFAQPHTRVYAHCSAGVNRGPSTAYAIMRALGWDGPAAFQQVKAHRPVAQMAYAGDADAAIQALGYA